METKALGISVKKEKRS